MAISELSLRQLRKHSSIKMADLSSRFVGRDSVYHN